ncbi:tRNA (uridine(54)-C5)-methyltransferase TrmA [Campylobacter sp. RM9344]|uniref:tRNA (Uridine(54)-C5)-methyltransferase TrmA n=1 Tax=Campylobacter californiensis TaxID=1032243 RepID=A0AAW3ZX30_9BACT|nr:MULTISPECIES: tRNA (uridine(54)-C5)-methyltransferase TrmA [unclassified Campylobacter]MBE2985299.1 tRNA (uridine(54)-C5)-methyltransferase TrmA [Campylobacter sp. RM6883]MBE2987137.1 tRNA (uridine(54)-C5)-methyltransferase TrmA [Campylobacter sp. RM12919]MBE2988815.1 tRNA (uridine(54)-C5)-methyltransferase TrmA [Campylobacter sp. RM12920]MBE2995940.1 tRNA (uridine(54)-C5)-methyltransferase TrmA [Campylobacter sp. RM6913]MBE3030053.1 tRNA (uridine(54)-C5)-methyltransferase TrmA [Campylobact
MQCCHFKECGSCTLEGSYEEQKAFKLNAISSKFSEFYDKEFEFFASNEKNYRIRAEFGIWHEADKIYYTMHSKNKGERIFVRECPKVCEQIVSLMSILLNELESDAKLKHRLFGVEFISCSSGVLVTLLYHKKLEATFLEHIVNLANKLDITIIARSRGQKILSHELNLIDELKIDGRIYKFHLSENAFIQPNKAVNEKMITWAKINLAKGGKDLLELYCGHGNFTIPLSENFKNVLATEISKSSIFYALKNCDINDTKNIKFLRLSANELISAFKNEREFNRLKDINLHEYDFSHILVDPPRAGLEPSVINFIKNYENIIYISCNPDSLYENLIQISQTHEVVKFAVFDQFAHTHHVECGVLLRKKNG